MADKKPRLTSIRNVYVLCFPGKTVEAALSLGAVIDAELRLVGVISTKGGWAAGGEEAQTSDFRQSLEGLAKRYAGVVSSQVITSATPWQDLRTLLIKEHADLLCLDWPADVSLLSADIHEILRCPPCNVALVQGTIKAPLERVLVPLRGGPHAELALRVTLGLGAKSVDAFHFLSTSPESDLAFKGLSLILPQLPGVTPRYETSDDPAQRIISESATADVIVMGCSVQPLSSPVGLGPVADRILKGSKVPVIAVQSAVETPADYYGNEMVGRDAISLLVNHWFAEKTFKADKFSDLEKLLNLKKQSGQKISLVLPTLNQEESVGAIIRTMQTALVKEAPLLDEILVVDSGSTDRTREIATELGVPVCVDQELLPELGTHKGRGEALWKSLAAAKGDIIVWLDTRHRNIHARMVYGLVGPLLNDSRLKFTKACCARALDDGNSFQTEGDGWLTELTARPLLNLFYPELSGVVKPLAGDCAGRRSLLETLPFYSGSGVEMGLLIDIFEKAGLNAIGQVEIYDDSSLEQTLDEQSKKAFAVVQVVLNKLEQKYGRAFIDHVNRSRKLIKYTPEGYSISVTGIVELQRPPMREIPAYQKRSLGK